MKRRSLTLVSLLLCSLLWEGCTPAVNQVANNLTASMVPQKASDLQRVVDAQYDSTRSTVVLHTQKSTGKTGENIIDVSMPEGVMNYVNARYPGKVVRSVQIVRATGGNSVINSGMPAVTAPLPTVPASPGSPALAAGVAAIALPPSVRIDRKITPRAPLNASLTAKENAVLQVAKSKLGTPYVWGHNEDRGQVGFDCSNFTEYVYHHALGYLFTTSSRGQYQVVGVPVAKANMRVGDLLTFNQGSHVGIYAGNGQMIQEGGGLGKVGYLSVKPGSYWGNHISAVKRMF